jgi:hypothetical protein
MSAMVDSPNAPVSPPPPPRARRELISRSSALVLVAVAEFGALMLVYLSFGLSLCSVEGETCSPAEKAMISLVFFAGVAVGVAGPVWVAWLRRSAVWVLVPVVVLSAIWGLRTLQVHEDHRRHDRQYPGDVTARKAASAIDRILAYHPPTSNGRPVSPQQARQVFGAAVEKAKPALAAQGMAVIAVRDFVDVAGTTLVDLTIDVHGTHTCISYYPHRSTAFDARGGDC